MLARRLAPALLTLALAALPAAAFAQPAATPPTHYLPRPGGVIAYEDWGGPGRLVIAAPGMGDVRGEYRFLAPRLRAAGLHVVVMDVRGFGQSSAVWRDYSAHAVGGDMLALAARLGGGKPIMIGTSFAAGAAVWAARDAISAAARDANSSAARGAHSTAARDAHSTAARDAHSTAARDAHSTAARDAPGGIAGMVLIGPVLRDQPMPFYARAALWAGFAGPWRIGFWLTYWDSLLPLHKPADHAAYRQALGENLRQPGRMEALQAMIMLSKADTAAILTQTHAPALIVMGTADPDFGHPAQEAGWLADQLGAATLLVPGAGHYPQVELPDQVAARIVAFAASLR